MESTNMEFTITSDTIVEKGGDEEDVKFKRLLALRREVIDAKNAHNAACQQLHDAKRSKVHLKNMIEESNAYEESLRSEVEQMKKRKEEFKQAKIIEIINPLKSKLKSLEDEIISLQRCNSREIEVFNEKIVFLRKQMQSDDNSDRSFNFKVNKEQLLLEKHELEQENLLKQKELEDKLHLILKLRDDSKSLSLAINESKEILESVNSELEIVKEERKELIDEIALIKSQVSMSKSKPQVEGARGNSLFGEIDDKREVFIKKIKQLKKAYSETMQSVTRTASTLKKLQVEYNTIIDESKKNEVTELVPETSTSNKIKVEYNTMIDESKKNEVTELVPETSTSNEIKVESIIDESKKNEVTESAPETSISKEIKKLEEKYSKLVKQYKYMPCQADSTETFENRRNIDYKINKSEDEIRSIKKKVQKYSVSCLKVGQDLYCKKLRLIDIQSSLFLEQAKHANLTALLKDYKRSESILEETEESIQEPQSEKLYESKDTIENSAIDSAPSTSNMCINQEKIKPEKDKKKAPLKFINIQKKINLDDL